MYGDGIPGRNKRRFIGKGIPGYARYMIFKQQLRITQTDHIASRRLEAIVFYADFGLEPTLQAFSISKSTLYLWRSKYLKANKDLRSLKPQTTRPRRVRKAVYEQKIEEFVELQRELYPRLGKKKVKVLLDRYCEKEQIPKISESTIGRIITRKKLFFYGSKNVYYGGTSIKRRKKRPRVDHKKKATRPGEQVQIDAVVRFDDNIKRYIVTAIDTYTRFGFALAYERLTSKNKTDFFKRLEVVFPFEMESVKTDNGSEFFGYFDKHLEEIGVKHYYIHPKTPKHNAYIERFNRTIQEEYVDEEVEALRNVEEFNEGLIDYLIYYNMKRPHQSLNYLTPMEYIVSNYLLGEKSNMSWTTTPALKLKVLLYAYAQESSYSSYLFSRIRITCVYFRDFSSRL